MLFGSVLAFLAAPFMFKPAEVIPSVPDQRWKTAGAPIDKLIGWLETKDPNETYPWWSPTNCLFAQFGTALGYTRKPYTKACDLFDGEPGQIGYGQFGGAGRTFGEALMRARAYKATY